MRRGLIVDSFEHFCVAKLNDGAFLPLDDLLEYSEKADSLLLGDGDYLVEAGVRTRGGDVRFRIIPIRIDSGAVLAETIDLDIPIRERKKDELRVRQLDSIPSLFFTDARKKSISFADLVSQPRVLLFIFDWQTEPPKRMLNLVAPLARRADVKTCGVFMDSVVRFNKDLVPEMEILTADPAKLKAVLRIESIPSTLLFKNGKLIYWDEGYNLNIGAELEQVLGVN